MSVSTKDPKFSKSWDEPCLTRTEDDGSKTEWYERELSGPDLQTMADLLSCIEQQNALADKFESAKIIVQSMSNLNKNQELLFEKLITTNPGKKIVEGEGKLNVVTNIGHNQ